MDGNSNKPIDARPLNRPAILGLLSRSGPEAPPDPPKPAVDPAVDKTLMRAPAVDITGAPLPRRFSDEPTQQFPVIGNRPAASANIPVLAPGRPGPAKVQARAVIVYERRSWGLLLLTAVLVALTTGVILGQTVADVPRTASAAAQTQPADAGFSAPPTVVPSPSDQAAQAGSGAPGQALPVIGERISAPLGKVRALQLQVDGGATLVTVRSVDLGDRLFDIAALDGSAVPRVVPAAAGQRLEFVRTGAPGRVGAVIQLNAKVTWKLRLAGGAVEQDIDMRAGGLAGIEFTGGVSRAVLELPAPKATVPLRVSGAVSALEVRAARSAPVRVKLAKGADSAVIDAKARTKVKPGTTLTPPGWRTATGRYDITASAKIGTIKIVHV